MSRFCLYLISVLLFVSNYHKLCSSGPVKHLQFKDKIEVQIEWLLDELINTLSKFASEVETDPTILESRAFRSALVRVVVRMTDVIETIEMKPKISSQMSTSIHRLDSVRIRLNNFVSNYMNEPNDYKASTKTVKITTTGTSNTDTPILDINQIMAILTEIMDKIQTINANSLN